MAAQKKHSWFDIDGLIQELKKLYRLLNQRIWHQRLNTPRPSKAGQSAEIHTALGEHIDTKAGEHNIRAEEPETDSASYMEQARAAKRNPPKETPRLGVFKALSGHFSNRRRTVGVGSQPHLARQMQAKTQDHINRALQLARQGQAGTAKMHIQLAEEAMRTASQYMPEAEYTEFKAQVEARLNEIRAD